MLRKYFRNFYFHLTRCGDPVTLVPFRVLAHLAFSQNALQTYKDRLGSQHATQAKVRLKWPTDCSLLVLDSANLKINSMVWHIMHIPPACDLDCLDMFNNSQNFFDFLFKYLIISAYCCSLQSSDVLYGLQVFRKCLGVSFSVLSFVHTTHANHKQLH